MKEKMKDMCLRYMGYVVNNNIIILYAMQRIAQSTREGGPLELNLHRFSEALEDLSSGLTYPGEAIALGIYSDTCYLHE